MEFVKEEQPHSGQTWKSEGRGINESRSSYQLLKVKSETFHAKLKVRDCTQH